MKLSKCYFGCVEIEYLGHVVGLGKVSPRQQKVNDLLRATKPESKRQLQSWLGLAGYYRKFIPRYSELTAFLTDLLGKGKKFVWTPQCDVSFEEIKVLMTSSPVLFIANFEQPFFIFVDASDVAVASILMQQDKDKLFHPVSYYSKKLNAAQRNYSATDKEALALVLSVRAFRVYLSGGKTTVYTDHEALKYIYGNAGKNQRLLRWSLELQPYNFSIEHIQGRDNMFADYMSRHVSVDSVDENMCLPVTCVCVWGNVEGSWSSAAVDHQKKITGQPAFSHPVLFVPSVWFPAK